MTKPVIKHQLVPLPPRQAFNLFINQIGRWWPVETHSLSASLNKSLPKNVYAEPREGGEILEVCFDGEIRPWGTITDWHPGERLNIKWYVGRPETEATLIEITFEADKNGTRLKLVHSGFDALKETANEIRQGYDAGWNGVLGANFQELCSRAEISKD
ncbi:MAG: hypothetical protein GKR98_08155 [Boseongicola sp.]|nr:MAG: hypothetical protein GKR98_08155 [Boseongicola sp.]